MGFFVGWNRVEMVNIRVLKRQIGVKNAGLGLIRLR